MFLAYMLRYMFTYTLHVYDACDPELVLPNIQATILCMTLKNSLIPPIQNDLDWLFPVSKHKRKKLTKCMI